MNVKKITLSVAIVATALALFACNKQPKETLSTEPTQAETATDTQTVAAEAEAAAQGADMGTDAQPPAEPSTQDGEPAATDGADGEKAEDKVSEDQKY